jgi:phage shock protein A
MSIFNRVNDVIQSNIAAMLDKAEDPEKLLNLMLSDMHEALKDWRSTAAALLCEEKTLKRQIAQKQKDLISWQTKAELAVAKNRDDLAKSALVEKQRVDEQIAAKNTQLNTLKESIEKITADCERLQQKMAQAKSKQAQLIKRHDIVAAREKVNMQLHSDNVANTLSRFEMIEQKVEGIEAQVDAYELTNTAQSTAEQIETLVKNEKIDAELARLKASVKQSNSNTTARSA